LRSWALSLSIVAQAAPLVATNAAADFSFFGFSLRDCRDVEAAINRAAPSDLPTANPHSAGSVDGDQL